MQSRFQHVAEKRQFCYSKVSKLDCYNFLKTCFFSPNSFHLEAANSRCKRARFVNDGSW